MSEIEVTGADRKAAATAVHGIGLATGIGENFASVRTRVLDGRADGHEVVQSYARHRIAATAELEASLAEAAMANARDEYRALYGARIAELEAENYALREALELMLCEDCPPVGYPTDQTRCEHCPRRQALSRERNDHEG